MRLLCFLLALVFVPGSMPADVGHADVRIPVLVYHRFGPVAADSMTVTTRVFASQLKYLSDNGYNVVPLREVVKYILDEGPAPTRAVAITVDDAHRTVFTDMRPLVERYHIPVTLFVYPSAISNAPYAMTWDQLAELKQTGLFDIQSHTYWHPNFRQEKRRLSPAAYDELVRMQLVKAKAVLQERLGSSVDMLAWPFGIYDDELIRAAREAGYVAGFTLERRFASRSDNVMALPRHLMTDNMKGKAFEDLLVLGR